MAEELIRLGYEALGEAKVTIVRSGASSLLQYSEAKTEVLRELVERALVWRAAT